MSAFSLGIINNKKALQTLKSEELFYWLLDVGLSVLLENSLKTENQHPKSDDRHLKAKN
ncbi:hypothetical protein [Arcicella rosea]|uniref:Uncharacterized protein n=1 Tax=Arcicella rosea TaxID=502909 RepID=A0A841EUH0_9BACT|nr:hypothetical protein [Arcicella rosea]MBB6005029.1 hypothetical protein [Arcicella rosea]